MKRLIITFIFASIVLCQDKKEEDIKQPIEKLGSDELEVREDATKKLIEIGKSALPELKKVVNHEDPKVSARGKNIIDEIKRNSLKIFISATRQKYKLNDNSEIECKFTNECDEDVIILPPLEGSFEGYRQPFYEWKITDINGNNIHEEVRTIFIKIEAFKKGDFIALKGGQTFVVDKSNWWDSVNLLISEPGRYKISLRYSLKRDLSITKTSSTKISGENEQGVEELMQKALEVEKWSNEIEIEVE